MEKFRKKEISISSLTTDRHVQIRSYMKEEHPQIKHQFHVWHFAKNIKKKIVKKAKLKSCSELFDWVKAIVNHFWWCCASCGGNAQELKEKWISILYHITNQHSWENHEIFKQCEHPDLSFSKQRKWLHKGSCAYAALEKIKTDKNLLKDLHYLSDFSHTGNLEVYHSLCQKFCQKRLYFSMHGMICRTMIAVLDHNCSANLPQTTTSYGTLRYK